ncbi:Haloalkane dehalogenase [Aspergillus alliaceus]|uniref:Haloalkane dehalogenase n=1 Tax=Petromyces alliaceus TaxID=209559 RepID=UPI0012A6D448|nr:Haloalkane dehalogenase [Aspergillus alliaceus]KAB8226989.1 Haloalkane dehalogenase [Aspergillus alliaceus]
MSSQRISPRFPFTKDRVSVIDTTMAYVDTGLPVETSPTVVFLHGNPTSSYLYRNIIPHILPIARCIVPDLVGFGDSGKMPSNGYFFSEHVPYLAAFMDAVAPKEKSGKIFLVVHDWGSALGFDWARKNPLRIAGLVFMEFISGGLRWEAFPPGPRDLFQKFRTETTGRELLIEQNVLIEGGLRQGVTRDLSEDEMQHYRRPFLDPRDREPIYRFVNEIPFDEYPQDVSKAVEMYWQWLRQSRVPKLMFWAEPGTMLSPEKAAEMAHDFIDIRSVGIGPGSHFLQEDNPHLIGEEIKTFVERFKSTD